MDIFAALEQTATRKGPLSAIDRLFEALDAEHSQRVRNVITDSGREAAHIGRALTVLARHHKVIGETSRIDGQSVQAWRAKNVA